MKKNLATTTRWWFSKGWGEIVLSIVNNKYVGLVDIRLKTYRYLHWNWINDDFSILNERIVYSMNLIKNCLKRSKSWKTIFYWKFWEKKKRNVRKLNDFYCFVHCHPIHFDRNYKLNNLTPTINSITDFDFVTISVIVILVVCCCCWWLVFRCYRIINMVYCWCWRHFLYPLFLFAKLFHSIALALCIWIRKVI